MHILKEADPFISSREVRNKQSHNLFMCDITVFKRSATLWARTQIISACCPGLPYNNVYASEAPEVVAWLSHL